MRSKRLEAGSTALVVGSRRDRRAFCIRHLATAERSAAAVLPGDPAGAIEEYRRAGGRAPLTLVVDGGAAADETVDAGEMSDGSDVRAIDVDSGSLPAVGEATIGTLETGGADPPVDRLWFAGLSGLLERVSLQQVYRLLYILSERVRQGGGVGLYALGPSIERKTARILRQPLDYEVRLAAESTPEIRALAGRPADA